MTSVISGKCAEACFLAVFRSDCLKALVVAFSEV